MKNNLDIAKNEDLFFALMNMISIEEHLVFTAMKTKKDVYLQVLSSIRSLRKSLMKKILQNSEGEMWCVSKHFMALTMRLIEVGSKHLQEKNLSEAKEFYRDAFDMYTLFWFLQKIGGSRDGKSGKKSRKMEE